MAIPILAGIGLGVNALSSLAGGIFGAGQKRQANRLERNNPLPIAQVNQNLLANVAQANQMAQVGLPQQQYNNALQQQQQAFAGGLRTLGRSGGTSNLATLLRGQNQGINNLNVADAQARQANQRLLMQQRGVLANEEQRVWNWNKAQPYLRTMQQVASLRNAGNQNMFGALGNLASAATQLGTASMTGNQTV